MSEPRRWFLWKDVAARTQIVQTIPHPNGMHTEVVEATHYDKLAAELEILKSKASQFESTLKETMRVRDEEIERLKRVVDVLKIQRCRLLSEKFAGFPLNAMNAESELDAELTAMIEGET